jgi:hypothetical protein
MPRNVVAEDHESLNLTHVYFMCNTNQPVRSQEAWDTFKTDTDLLVKTALFQDAEAMDTVFGKAPLVDTVSREQYAAEVGHRKFRGHFNLSVKIWHQVDKYSVGKLRLRLADWLDETHPLPRGRWNVLYRLGKTYLENYSNKEQRREANADAKDSDPEEYERLADDREMHTIENALGDSLQALRLNDNPRIDRLVPQ